ncbi:hypothetical protein D3C77_522940 [compost metagenome]
MTFSVQILTFRLARLGTHLPLLRLDPAESRNSERSQSVQPHVQRRRDMHPTFRRVYVKVRVFIILSLNLDPDITELNMLGHQYSC